MADIFREVDEDLRRERAHEIWRKYGAYILAAAVFVVVATVAVVAWREWRQSQLRAHSAEMVAALELASKGQQKEAADSLAAFSNKAADGHALLARLDEAALRVKLNDTAAAAALYDKVANDTDAPAVYRDMALIMLGLNTFETADPATMIQRLAPLTGGDNPMRFSAIELTALFERKAGNLIRARELLKQLGEEAQAPAPLRERAREVLRALGDDGAGTKGAS